jgi:hypothetical protein
MSLVDPAFESNVITLLKGIYDNIGSGLPYKIISGKMYLDESLMTLVIDELVNETEYTIDTNVGINAIGFVINTAIGAPPILNNCQLFLGPAQAINNSSDPAFFTISNNDNPETIASWNITGFVGNVEDLSAFGLSSRPVDFEVRIYT